MIRLIDRARGEARAIDLGWLASEPSNEAWALAPDALRLLMSLVTVLRPRHVLEMGSGVSTRALARACGALPGRRRISSIDHDPDFGPDAAAAFGSQPVAPAVHVTFQLAPIVAREYGGRIVPVYRWQPSRFASRRPVDLVVIDGPPAVLGGRVGTVYQVMDVVRAGAVIVLDDASRAGERAAMAEWQDVLGPAIDVRYFSEYAKGLAAIVVREPVPRAALWRHQQEACAAELDVLVPPGARYLQPDAEGWDRPMLPGRQRQTGLLYPPSDDAEGLSELERASSSADFFVLLWPSFWWVTCYPALFAFLDGTFPCPVRNARMRVYDLRTC